MQSKCSYRGYTLVYSTAVEVEGDAAAVREHAEHQPGHEVLFYHLDAVYQPTRSTQGTTFPTFPCRQRERCSETRWGYFESTSCPARQASSNSIVSS